MAFWKRTKTPPPAPDPKTAQLAALRAREAALVAERARLEAAHLECEDIAESARLLDEINELNAQIGVARDDISEF